jgi:hypothetical protein
MASSVTTVSTRLSSARVLHGSPIVEIQAAAMLCIGGPESTQAMNKKAVN